jgi:transcriptional regulator with XRE-family HTH domain
MNTVTMPEKKVHEGRNIKRIREMLGIKQEVLAAELDISQQSVSLLEQKETVDPSLLEQVAKVLNVPVEAIKNFSEESVIYNIQHNHEGSNPNATSVAYMNHHCNFNPLDKVIELYERLLQVEREKNELLQGKK